jgi:excisionase family DNA binding protein
MSDMYELPGFLTVNEAMAQLKTGRTRLYRLLTEGKITARKHGSRTLIEVESVKAYTAGLPVASFHMAPEVKKGASEGLSGTVDSASVKSGRKPG